MLAIDAEAAKAIAPELSPGETVLWAGRPEPGVRFRKEDAFLVPFSLLWGGGVIFIATKVFGLGGGFTEMEAPLFLRINISIFLLVGQYFIWGRFVYANWKKKRTFYAVTNRRVIAVQNGLQHRTASAFLDTLPTLELEGRHGRSGSLRFAPSEPMFSRMGMVSWDGMAMGSSPCFVDVAEARELYQLILERREQLRAIGPQRTI